MPVGYGYQSREDSSYVNWAEVAKGFTDVIDADIKDREKRKADYDKQDRDLAKTLADAPMGQYKDGNDFTANYVDAMTKQRLMDYKLFKAGKLKERDYTLKTNNAIDGTNTLFDLQKKYQEEYKTKMAGLADNSLQALNGFNMANTEGFADFSKTRAMLDPIDGKVKLMKMKFNEKTGIMEPTQDIVPVGTLMRNMSTNIPTFDLDGATTNDVENMGELKTSILQAATLGRAGSVTSFVNSPEMFEKTFPGGKAIVEEFNKAITNNVNKYLSIPYNLTSILTQNTGKYDAESFTYNKDEAAKDPSKILLKINPNTGLPIMDEDAPNYAKQREEAFGLAKNQILSKLDREKQIQTSTGQLSDVTSSRYQFDKTKEEKNMAIDETARLFSLLVTGTPEEQKNSAIALGREGLPVTVTKEGKMTIGDEEFEMKGNVKNFITSSGHTLRKLADNLGVPLSTILNRSREFAGNKGFSLNDVAASAVVPDETARDYQTEYKNIVDQVPTNIFGGKAKDIVSTLTPILSKLNVTVKDTTGATGGYVTFRAPGKEPLQLPSNQFFSGSEQEQLETLIDYLNESFPNPKEIETVIKSVEAKQKANPPANPPKPGGPAPRPGGK